MREQVPPCVHSSTPLSLRLDACIRVYGKGDRPCIGNRGQDPTTDGYGADRHCFPRETMILRATLHYVVVLLPSFFHRGL